MTRTCVLPLAPLALFLCAAASAAGLPLPTFYLPLDGSPVAALAGGSKLPVRNATTPTDTILELLSGGGARFAAGQVGQAYDAADQALVYECAGNFRPDEGTAAFWVSPEWRGDSRGIYCTLFGAANWGMVYKYQDQTSLTFATAKPEGDLYYDCGASDISAWRPGQWHHVAVTWSRVQNERRMYIDGRLRGRAPFPFCREVKTGPLFVGAGCTMYPEPVAHAKLDEFALWDCPLDEVTVQALFAQSTAGKPLWEVPGPPAQAPADAATGAVSALRAQSPPPPTPNEPTVSQTGPRTTISLNGWWQFLPATDATGNLPTTGWGLTRVPGYWTTPADTLDPGGQPTNARWGDQPMSRYSIAHYQRTFVAAPAWRGRRAILRIGGVDGLAQVFVNGRSLGWLPGWEPEGYDIAQRLNYGQENTITIALHTRGGSEIAGIYGDVDLCLVPGPFVNDLTIRPLVQKGQIAVDCGVHSGDAGGAATLEFAVSPRATPDKVVRRFTLPCRLTGLVAADVSSGMQHLTATFDWKDAHRWTIDDPFLYRMTARLTVAGVVCDSSGPYRFGFREFTQRGADFLLNGKPFHLRGHQIDLPWGNQFDRVKELKAAGLNALELSGPICSNWYAGTPYQKRLFEDILDYCDEHGLIALPVLPDLAVIRERIFDPQVAALYKRRVEKHIRTFGNHPSIGMWYMHFNLASHLWYMAPSKMDGSYKRDDPDFKAKEHYALEAQRIAQSIDPRPIYHHACGNFGGIFTANLYLGPNSPTQEREEWPSRWAEKRPFPFLACEHCCMLIPYWFRPRQFPLSVVYAGEPIFDEICAMYQGPDAYGHITPQLFDLYDTDRATPRDSRLHALIANHPGYQAVKSKIARLSLRSWRTYGVSGIIFNAENWDFKDDAGNPLPVMQAMARYFGDTDLYIAGPGTDWPSKDHSFYSGEMVRKQIVLLNDLQRDIPCTLEWRLADAAGKVRARGQIAAVSKAGTPTFYPVEFTAPQVAEREDFTLTVEPVKQPKQDFKPESFAIQVFPLRRAPTQPCSVVLYDPVGDTERMLQKAGISFTPLSPTTELSATSLLIVGRKSYDANFAALAKSLNHDRAVRNGLRVLAFEQTTGAPFGLKLDETSARDAFPASPGHPLLAGLKPADLRDLRGQSDLMEAYPDAPSWSKERWPPRCWKWGNRGILATYVYRKPHYSPFVPVLDCGFDLAQSPLLQARLGKGSVTLCQVDVTPRYGADPVSTRLVDNLLRELSRPGEAQPACSFVGASAREFVKRFGITPEPFSPDAVGVILVGAEPLGTATLDAIERTALRGATVVLLPGAISAGTLGLKTQDARLFIGRMTVSPLLTGMNDSDLFLKAWQTLPTIIPADGWTNLVQPGLLATKQTGAGRIIACTLDPDKLGKTRGRVKALRFWDILLANLGVGRTASLTEPALPAYEDNEWEQIPPYMGW